MAHAYLNLRRHIDWPESWPDFWPSDLATQWQVYRGLGAVGVWTSPLDAGDRVGRGWDVMRATSGAVLSRSRLERGIEAVLLLLLVAGHLVAFSLRAAPFQGFTFLTALPIAYVVLRAYTMYHRTEMGSFRYQVTRHIGWSPFVLTVLTMAMAFLLGVLSWTLVLPVVQLWVPHPIREYAVLAMRIVAVALSGLPLVGAPQGLGRLFRRRRGLRPALLARRVFRTHRVGRAALLDLLGREDTDLLAWALDRLRDPQDDVVPVPLSVQSLGGMLASPDARIREMGMFLSPWMSPDEAESV